jgi:hypothetical protein
MGEGAGDAPAPGLAAAGQFPAEQPDGDLGLAVGAHAVVGTLPVEVVPVDRVPGGGDADLRGHPSPPGAQQGQQVRHEGEVPQMVGAELQLEAVGRALPLRRRHHPGVGDQDVDRPVLLQQGPPQCGHGRQRREIQGPQRHVGTGHRAPDPVHGGLALDRVADRQDHFRTGRRDPPGEAEAHPVAGAGDHRPPAGQVGDDDIEGRA